MDKVSIVIATFGDDKWRKLANKRALPSCKNQAAEEIIQVHETNGTAASCKNTAIAKAKNPWIVICDADDELEPGYVEAGINSSGDMRYPMVRYIPVDYQPGSELPNPICLDRCSEHLRGKNLLCGNFMVIGTMFRRDEFLKIGGFSEFESWEDWYAWMQLVYLGAVPVLVPKAVYRVYQHRNSRVKVADPMKLFLHMKNQFREWAVGYNGGRTTNQHYRKFITTGEE